MAVTPTKSRAMLENTVSVIEGTTPDNNWHGLKRYRHSPTVETLQQLRTARDASRCFMLDLTGTRSLDGNMLQATEPGTVIQTLELKILYPHSDNRWELLRIIAEDVDRLGYRLMLASLFDANTTGLWRRRVDGYSLELGEAAGDVATVTLPVEVQYRPTF